MPMDLQSTRLKIEEERLRQRSNPKANEGVWARESWKHLCNIIFNQIMKTFYLLLFFILYFFMLFFFARQHRCHFYLCADFSLWSAKTGACLLHIFFHVIYSILCMPMHVGGFGWHMQKKSRWQGRTGGDMRSCSLAKFTYFFIYVIRSALWVNLKYWISFWPGTVTAPFEWLHDVKV